MFSGWWWYNPFAYRASKHPARARRRSNGEWYASSDWYFATEEEAVADLNEYLRVNEGGERL